MQLRSGDLEWKNEEKSIGEWSCEMVEEKLSKYEILQPIGRGSSSFVYKALHRKEKQYFVILGFYIFYFIRILIFEK